MLITRYHIKIQIQGTYTGKEDLVANETKWEGTVECFTYFDRRNCAQGELEFDQVEQKLSAKAEPQIYYPVSGAP